MRTYSQLIITLGLIAAFLIYAVVTMTIHPS
jgi:hypothetical protein